MASTYPNNWNSTIFPAAKNVNKLIGYLPELYARKTLKKFYENSVLPRVVNTVYAPELRKYGDKIYIRQKPVPTIDDYTVGTDLKLEQLSAPEPITVTVDKAKSWQYVEHDLTTQQTDLKGYMNEAAFEASKALQNAIEPAVLADIVTMAAAAGVGNAGASAGAVSQSYNLGTTTAPVTLTDGDASATNLLANLYGCLMENNALNESQRPFVLCPNRFITALAKSSLAAANITGDTTGVIRGGQRMVGVVQGMELYGTNYLKHDATTTTSFPVLCGTLDAVTFVMQVTKTEKVRHPYQFGNIVRGLAVYGYQLVKPEAMCLAWVKFAS